jgi:hypothetical protein
MRIQGFGGTPEGRRLLGRRRNRWEDNIKMNIHEMVLNMDWIDVNHDRHRRRAVVNAAMNLRFHKMRGIS